MPSRNKLLSICSTRNHPERLREMLKSWRETRTFGDMVVHIWKKDPKIKEYKELFEEFPEVRFFTGEEWFMGEVLNFYSSFYDQYDYYQNINDDHYYVKKGWDKLMTEPLDKKKGMGICYTKGKGNKHNPNAEIISGKIVRGLGYYIFPKFRQFGFETYIEDIGKMFGFYFVEETIEHRSVNSGHGEKDKEYKFIYGTDEQLNYAKAVEGWNKVKERECKKIVI